MCNGRVLRFSEQLEEIIFNKIRENVKYMREELHVIHNDVHLANVLIYMSTSSQAQVGGINEMQPGLYENEVNSCKDSGLF